MSPFEHGEVFVTDDGAETDLDPWPLRALQPAVAPPPPGRGGTDSCVVRADLFQRAGTRNAGAITWGAHHSWLIPHVTNEIKDFLAVGDR